MHIRDRIKELRRVRASDLRPNPRNWRLHPPVQQDALRGVLAEVEWRQVTESTDGPVELAKVRCLRRHSFLLPVAHLERPLPTAARVGATP